MAPLRPSPHGLFLRLVALTGLAVLGSAQQVLSFAPDDARIVYSDYACGHVGPTSASFDRDLPGSWVCHQEQMSPGVRATFLVDASHIRFDLDYHFAGFYCGSESAIPLSWEFGLVIDGVRRPTGARNPLYPLEFGSTPWIPLGSGPGPHQIILVWPSAADVDLGQVHLMQTQEGTAPNLLQAPPRTQPLLAVFGDSISHGLDASNVLDTYPARLGAVMGWRVTNLGFSGRNTQPLDAWLAAGYPGGSTGDAPVPDMLLLEIGSNDFHLFGSVHTNLNKFESNYRAWVDNFRSLRPTTPMLVVTPLPRGDECTVRNRQLEDYRQVIRSVITERADPRIYLFEGRDLIALPPQAGSPLYDSLLLHPTDLGSALIVENLQRFNLVRNAGFELRPILGCTEVAEPEPYLWTRGGTGPSSVIDGPDGTRTLSLGAGGTRTQMVLGLSEGDAYTLRVSGMVTAGGQVGHIVLEFLDGAGALVDDPRVLPFPVTDWRTTQRRGVAPAGAIKARLTLDCGPGSGQFLVDDLELTVESF